MTIIMTMRLHSQVPDKECKELFGCRVGATSGAFLQGLLPKGENLQHHPPN